MSRAARTTAALCGLLGSTLPLFFMGACVSNQPSVEASQEDVDFCETGCDRIKALDCSAVDQDSCEAGCLDNLESRRRAYPSCIAKLDAYQECFGSSESSDFECTSTGAGLKEGVCQAESDALTACTTPGGEECAKPCKEHAPLCGVTLSTCVKACSETTFPDLSSDEQEFITACLSDAADCDEAQSCLSYTWPSEG